MKIASGQSICGPQLRTEKWRPDIEGLRGLAIAFVMVYHATPALLPGGFIGVDIFFVISGFLVGGLVFSEIEQNIFSFQRFYERRIKRLLPSLALVVSVSMAAAMMLLRGRELGGAGNQAAASLVFVGNFIAWHQSGYFDGDIAYKPLIHLWSLGIEEQYYLLLPAAAVVMKKKCPGVAAIILAALFFLSLLLCVFTTNSDAAQAFYSPLTRFWELLAGSLMAWWQRSGSRKISQAIAAPLSLTGGCLCILSAIFVKEHEGFPGAQAIAPVLGALLLIASGPRSRNKMLLLQSKPLIALGRISYSCYLWHWPALVFSRLAQGGDLTPAKATVVVACVLPIAWLTTVLFEEPLRLGPISGEKNLPKIIILLALLLAAGCLSLPQWMKSDKVSPSQKWLSEYTENYVRVAGDLWRSKDHCFTDLGENVDFGESCLGGSGAGDLMVLWGDSHAAHLWPGLHVEATKSHYRLAQLTASQCPPTVRTAQSGNSQCAAMQNRALRLIEQLRPHSVILASSWTYGQEETDEIPETVRHLKALGVTKVIFVGPMPMWIPTLPNSLSTDMESRTDPALPFHTQTKMETSRFPLDKVVAARVKGSGAMYISPIESLCSPDRLCRIWVDESARDELMIFDAFHLTRGGSIWLAEKMSHIIFTETDR